MGGSPSPARGTLLAYSLCSAEPRAPPRPLSGGPQAISDALSLILVPCRLRQPRSPGQQLLLPSLYASSPPWHLPQPFCSFFPARPLALQAFLQRPFCPSHLQRAPGPLFYSFCPSTLQFFPHLLRADPISASLGVPQGLPGSLPPLSPAPGALQLMHRRLGAPLARPPPERAPLPSSGCWCSVGPPRARLRSLLQPR